MNIYEAAAKHRKELLAQNQIASTAMVRAYAGVWETVDKELGKITAKIQEAKNAGAPVSPFWLFQQDRYRKSLAQIETELRHFIKHAEYSVKNGQLQAVKMAEAHAHEAMRLQIGAPLETHFGRLSDAAFTELVGFTRQGSPLHDLLLPLPTQGVELVRQGLVQGLALGLNPRDIARRVKEGFGGNLARSLTVARTEILRAYREGSRQTYQANQDVVKGWTWHAALGTACLACTLMHGSFHKLDEPLAAHPNCRCAMIPVTKTWAEMGLPVKGIKNNVFKTQSGLAYLKGLSDKELEKLLGPKGFAAYKDGLLSLEDFLGHKSSPLWGESVYQRSVKQALTGPEAGLKPSYKIPELKNPNPAKKAGAVPDISDLIKKGGAAFDPKLFKAFDFDSGTKWIKAQFESWLHGLPSAERAALKTYTGGTYTQINSPLRTYRQNLDPSKLDPHIRDLIENLDKAYKRPEARIAEDIVLWRGTNWDEVYNNAEKMIGAVVSDPAFVSTTVSKGSAFGGNVVMKIYARAGTHGIGVQPISNFHHEAEILLPRNSRFKIIGVQRQGHQAIVEMELLP